MSTNQANIRNDLPPFEAYCFEARDVQFAEPVLSGDDAPRRRRQFSGVAYSGEEIAGHFWWGKVIFDLSSTRSADRVPVLIEHDRAKRAGHAALDISDDRVTARGYLLSNEHGQAIASDADEGFPWQMSVHIQPGRIEEVLAGSSVEVNGRTVVGPANVFRENVIREVSFTPTGADSRTSALVFSKPPTTEVNMATEQNATAEVAELKASLAAAQRALADVTARADAAEAKLADLMLSARVSDVRKLFADIGRTYSEEAASPYIALPQEQFAAVSHDLREAVKQARAAVPSNLFHAEAVGDPSAEDLSIADRIASFSRPRKV